MKLNLNFLGNAWFNGLRKRNFATDNAYGVASNSSLSQTPDNGLHITFLTVLPHASRDVRPTSASAYMISDTSSNTTQCS